MSLPIRWHIHESRTCPNCDAAFCAICGETVLFPDWTDDRRHCLVDRHYEMARSPKSLLLGAA